ncbi:MAG TPA: hypothetical protein DCQ06_05610 [Myxococcales bacterium]|nr:hypothetical protein [Myxococcales bacterium]HAN31056.1 hypothetical protein [Myxococcales bacterium]
MAIAQLFKRLFAVKPAAALVVHGVITETGRHTPRTRLGPNQASEQAYVALSVEQAATTDGQVIDGATIVPAEFSGSMELLEAFAVGKRVKITCSTLTGREIETIDEL